MGKKLKKAVAVAAAVVAAGVANEIYQDRKYFRELDRKDRAEKMWYAKRDIVLTPPTIETEGGFNWWDG